MSYFCRSFLLILMYVSTVIYANCPEPSDLYLGEDNYVHAKSPIDNTEWISFGAVTNDDYKNVQFSYVLAVKENASHNIMMRPRCYYMLRKGTFFDLYLIMKPVDDLYLYGYAGGWLMHVDSYNINCNTEAVNGCKFIRL